MDGALRWELLLYGLVLALLVAELISIRRTIRRDRQAAQRRPQSPGG